MVNLKHTQRYEMRYKPHILRPNDTLLLKQGEAIIDEWIKYIKDEKRYLVNIKTKQNLSYSKNHNSSISISCVCFVLHECSTNSVVGLYRNIMLTRRLLPTWQIRVFLSTNISDDIIKFLKLYKVLVIKSYDYTDSYLSSNHSNFIKNVHPTLLPLLILEDLTVERFIVRNVTHRITPRQTRLIYDWQMSSYSYHSIVDHKVNNYINKSHDISYFINSDSFGAVTSSLRGLINFPIRDILLKEVNSGNDMLFFIQKTITHLIGSDVLIHSSVPYDMNYTRKITQLPYNIMTVGQTVNMFEMS